MALSVRRKPQKRAAQLFRLRHHAAPSQAATRAMRDHAEIVLVCACVLPGSHIRRQSSVQANGCDFTGDSG
jgi:hypothetical protein